MFKNIVKCTSETAQFCIIAALIMHWHAYVGVHVNILGFESFFTVADLILSFWTGAYTACFLS